ncbi:MAG: hypothetical protein AAB217_12735, partial [Chloroflexota bacterium]
FKRLSMRSGAEIPRFGMTGAAFTFRRLSIMGRAEIPRFARNDKGGVHIQAVEHYGWGRDSSLRSE